MKGDRVTFSISVPFLLKKEIEEVKNEDESLNSFINKAIEFYLKFRKFEEFEDFENFFVEFLVNNQKIDLQKKYKIIKKLNKKFDGYEKELDDYFEYIKKNVKDEKELEQIKTMHKKGLMASWIVLKKRKEKNEKDN